VEVLEAQSQVVAGTNYKMKVKAEIQGLETKFYEAQVWGESSTVFGRLPRQHSFFPAVTCKLASLRGYMAQYCSRCAINAHEDFVSWRWHASSRSPVHAVGGWQGSETKTDISDYLTNDYDYDSLVLCATLAAKLPAHGGSYEVTKLDENSADQAGAATQVNP